MPFELGLAYSLKLMNPARYHVLVLDAKPHRMDRLLSDYKGRDLFIHQARSAGMVSCVLDSFEKDPVMTAANYRDAVSDLRMWAAQSKRDLQIDSLFRPSVFKALVDGATQIARARGFIAP